MASKTDFTEEEWAALQKGVVGTGMLVSISDRDFTDTFGEVGALAKYLSAQHEVNESPLLRELAEAHRSGFGLTASPEKVENETLAALRTATGALTAKAPDEVDGYKELVLGVADHVAEAKGGVTPNETAVIDKIKGALDAA
jgi:tellurite resistance protein